jgi:hypothetical protein
MKHEKRIILINLCIAGILALMAVSLAAYTSLSNAKRVVSTTGSNQLFSSNVLYAFDQDTGAPSTRSMSFPMDAAESTFTFTVCNYAQGDKTAWASRDISYTLTVRLLDENGNTVTDQNVLATYKLNGAALTGQDLEEKLTYNGTKVTENTYTVTLPTATMKDYQIYIVAKTDISGYDPIGRIISTTAAAVSNHWSGTFIDDIVDSDTHKPSELASINTRISGQEEETMVITWDTDYVEIDPWFLEDLADATVTTEKNIKTLTFAVGGEGQPDQYDISFFRTTSAKTLDETWADMKSHITFSTIEPTEQEA